LNRLHNHVIRNNGVSVVEVGSKEKVLKVSMKRLQDMLVQSGFLKKVIECLLERGDYCEFYEKKGHHIDECIESHQKVARILTLKELRIKAMKDSDEVRMIEIQEKMLEVCRV